MQIDSTNLNSVFGATVVDPNGAKVGTAKQVYVDKTDGHPLFTTVGTGLFGRSESFVPLQGATLVGDELRVMHDKDVIKDAPRVDPDGDLGDDDQNRIFDHYGIGTGHHDRADSDRADSDRADQVRADQDRADDGRHDRDREHDDAADRPAEREPAVASVAADRPTDLDRDRGPAVEDANGLDARTGDDAPAVDHADDGSMVRSEERLHVHTESAPATRARLKKYTVTEQRTITVPVQREEVRIEQVPVTDEEGVPAQREDLDGDAGRR
ncbi:PRC and DUF2382 domain-containing protein [Curtobacterium sp. ISL-83]|uniref:PRC and DUF2382 domain-containing protein n=1 Tax=Curtobacterium sp. ISL-83 TaxID=2819145 RepID=UPI001BE7D8BA|nr:PRC and DUF2382 domain-containing protein [Curtobacterium sp. ISL-83]MBT2502121.1 YsnF/AvaK domain-containing protein [Curtobacterium sp. ISL-83]